MTSPSGTAAGMAAVGLPALGFEMSADSSISDGWLIRQLYVPPDLDGPRGILQGGFSAGVLASAAMAVDPIGAPLTGIEARLHAPTPTGTTVEIDVRPGPQTAHYEVRTRLGATVLASGRVELAGHEPTSHMHDLAEIAAGPLPAPSPPAIFQDCWMCGVANPHPHAQRLFPGYRDDRTVVCGWVASEDLGDATGVIDPMVVAAALDCPTGWACAQTIAEMATSGPLLAGYRVRFLRAAQVMEPLRVVGHLDAVDGRKLSTRGAMIDDDGAVVAVTSALQIAVDEIPQPPC